MIRATKAPRLINRENEICTQYEGSDVYKRAMTLIRSAKLKKVFRATQDDPTSPTCQPDCTARLDSGRSENCLIMRVSYPVESACKEPSLNLLRLNINGG